MKELLSVENLSVSFGKKRVLKSVSLKVYSGEIVSVIGLNGAGKSTLLKAIMGLVPSSGKIDKKSSKIFYVPQQSDLNISFPLSVRELCELFGEEGFEEYLKELEVEGLIRKRVSELSGGQYQRVLMALALSRKPDVLMLDEVTAGVDVSGEEKFYKLILEIRKKYGVAIVLVSHDIHLMIKNADQVLCLAGHVCCSGKPSEVKEEDLFKDTFGKYLQPYIHKHDHIH